MRVAGIMNKSVVTIHPLATVREAPRMMKARGVKSLVVETRHSGDAYGLIAYRDAARAVIDNKDPQGIVSDTDAVGSLVERAANEN